MEKLDELWEELKAKLDAAASEAVEGARVQLQEIGDKAKAMYEAAKAELQECADELAQALANAAEEADEDEDSE